MKENAYSFESDSGKADMVTGKVLANYQWSGDAVYTLDQAEIDDYYLAYAVPEECTNVWFDGWVMLKDGIAGDAAKQQAAEAFINFMSRPDNVVRNMYYIGYTSVIAGGDSDIIYAYADWCYGAEDDAEDTIEYPVGFFFSGDNADEDFVITAEADQADRQLFAQYPPQDVLERAVVMQYFDQENNERINQMWVNVRCFETRDLVWQDWAEIGAVVIVVIAAAVIFKKRDDIMQLRDRKIKLRIGHERDGNRTGGRTGGGIYEFRAVYDTFMDNVPYEEWGEYIHGMLCKYGVEDGIVLDLGCGTGTMTEILAGYGYDMIGVDNSEDMLELAMEKRIESGHDILYLLQDMREFELYGTVRAVVSVCDSVNYVTEPGELEEVFRLVNNYLDPRGVFLFDFNTDYKYREIMGDCTIAEDRGECSFIWDNYYYENEQINEYDLTLFIQEKKPDETQSDQIPQLYRKYKETHYQRGYTLKEMQVLLEKAGLVFEAAYDVDSKEEPSDTSERICVIARESGKTGGIK